MLKESNVCKYREVERRGVGEVLGMFDEAGEAGLVLGRQADLLLGLRREVRDLGEVYHEVLADREEQVGRQIICSLL